MNISEDTSSSIIPVQDPGGIFISWTRADTDRNGQLGQLVDELHRLNVPVWIDDEKINAFDDITDNILDGISRAKVLLAWYSKAYSSRQVCQEELTLALLAQTRQPQQLHRVIAVNPETDASHIFETHRFDHRFAGVNDLQDVHALAAKIRDHVAAIGEAFGQVQTDHRPIWFGGSAWESGSERFVGRLKELWQIHDHLHHNPMTRRNQSGKHLTVITGLGGNGKSLLATQYAHHFRHLYRKVVWHSALGNDLAGQTPSLQKSEALANEAFSKVAVELLGLDITNCSEDVVRNMVKESLAARGEPILWIVDDLPSGLDKKTLGLWRCPVEGAHEIITTRDTAHTDLPTLRLDVLDDEAASTLILQGRKVGSSEAVEANHLARELGHHPLACDVAGLFLRRTGTPISEYRQYVKDRVDQFDDLARGLQDQLPGGHSQEIIATLAMSLDKYSDAQWELLRIATQLASAGIPRYLLAGILEELHPGENPNILLSKAISSAKDGLLEYRQKYGELTVHVLVRAVARIQDPCPWLVSATRDSVVNTMNQLFENYAESIKEYRQLESIVPHVREPVRLIV